MVILLKKCTIIDPRSKHHGKAMDLLIEKGTITKIGSKITSKKAKTINGKNIFVSPGWVDIGTHTGQPGMEQRDLLHNTLDAAAAGGFTRVALFSNDHSPIDHASGISFIKQLADAHQVHCHIIGALSKSQSGEEITELIDLHHSGAVGFSDGLHSIQKTGLLQRALDYTQSVDSIVLHRPNDLSLSANSQIHEGKVSTSLGIPGSPDIAEAVMVERDIALVKYTKGKLLLHLLSTEKGVNLIKKEKKNLDGQLFSSVSYHNLLETDETLMEFDENRKVNPPLRSNSDRQALIKAVQSDTIDIICSNHYPVEQEGKLKEFVYTDAGALGLQTCGVAMLDLLEATTVVEKLSINPRHIFKLPEAHIVKGSTAELTIWQAKENYTFQPSDNKSRSQNSPFFNTSYNHKVIGVISKNKQYFS